MGFAKEGFKWVGIFAFFTILSILLLPDNPVGFWFYFGVATAPLLGITIFMVTFFRDPIRIPEEPFDPIRSITSPADGNICAIEEENGNLAIYVEMHVSNVHVVRSPIDATVKKVTRASGKHHPIYLLKKTVGATSPAIRKNARVIIDLEDSQGRPATYHMVCGKIARRAVPYVKEGQFIKRGDKMGIIQFGSLIKMTLPGTKYQLRRKVTDRVYGGQTILCDRVD